VREAADALGSNHWVVVCAQAFDHDEAAEVFQAHEQVPSSHADLGAGVAEEAEGFPVQGRRPEVRRLAQLVLGQSRGQVQESLKTGDSHFVRWVSA